MSETDSVIVPGIESVYEDTAAANTNLSEDAVTMNLSEMAPVASGVAAARHFYFGVGEEVEVRDASGAWVPAVVCLIEPNGKYSATLLNYPLDNVTLEGLCAPNIRPTMRKYAVGTTAYKEQSTTRGNTLVTIVKYLGDKFYYIRYLDNGEETVTSEKFLRLSRSTPAASRQKPSATSAAASFPEQKKVTMDDLAAIACVRARVLSPSTQQMTRGNSKGNMNTNGAMNDDTSSTESFDASTPQQQQLSSPSNKARSGLSNIIPIGNVEAENPYAALNQKPDSMFKQIMNGFQGAKKSPTYSYFDVEDAIGERVQFDGKNRLSNNALDILALYIKGQKLLYTEAKTYCEQQLNFLMLPAIFISCVSSIFSFLSREFGKGDLIMASLSGFNAFLLAVISYLKLDAKAQAHKTSAYKFDKLESKCEFSSGKYMFFTEDGSGGILSVVNEIEKEVKEIKETNQFILPESIRYEFTKTYSSNVFLMVKKLQHTESTETQNLSLTIQVLKDLYENLPEIQNPVERDVAMQRIISKERKRDECIYNIIKCREEYFKMDEAFNEEIKGHIARANRWFITRMLFCDWLKS